MCVLERLSNSKLFFRTVRFTIAPLSVTALLPMFFSSPTSPPSPAHAKCVLQLLFMIYSRPFFSHGRTILIVVLQHIHSLSFLIVLFVAPCKVDNRVDLLNAHIPSTSTFFPSPSHFLPILYINLFILEYFL